MKNILPHHAMSNTPPSEPTVLQGKPQPVVLDIGSRLTDTQISLIKTSLLQHLPGSEVSHNGNTNIVTIPLAEPLERGDMRRIRNAISQVLQNVADEHEADPTICGNYPRDYDPALYYTNSGNPDPATKRPEFVR